MLAHCVDRSLKSSVEPLLGFVSLSPASKILPRRWSRASTPNTKCQHQAHGARVAGSVHPFIPHPSDCACVLLPPEVSPVPLLSAGGGARAARRSRTFLALLTSVAPIRKHEGRPPKYYQFTLSPLPFSTDVFAISVASIFMPMCRVTHLLVCCWLRCWCYARACVRGCVHVHYTQSSGHLYGPGLHRHRGGPV